MKTKQSIVKSVEMVCVAAHQAEFSQEFFNSAAASIKIVKAFYGLSDVGAALFSVMFNLNFRNQTVSIDDIARFAGCKNPISIYSLQPEINQLVEKNLLKIEGRRKQRKQRSVFHLDEYYINPEVEKNIWTNKKFIPQTTALKEVSDVWDLFSVFNDTLTMLVEAEISKTDAMDEVLSLLGKSEHISFVKSVKQLVLNDEELFLLIVCIGEHLTENGEIAISNIIKGLYKDDFRLQLKTKKQFISGEHPLQKLQLISLEEGTFRSDFSAALTDKTLEMISPEDSTILTKNKKGSTSLYNIIQAHQITPKNLFFGEKLQLELDSIKTSLMHGNFKSIMKRMEEMRLNKVFSLLLYGESGCGKTAFCQQLGFTTSRDIWVVNTSETKSQWFGSSEKLIKKVFDDYAKAVDKADIAPILLFNEADGIMSARQSNNKGTAISKTENAIASIILQSMEDIDNGSIIVATTNLPENMISNETGGNAISRRFTQKIGFELPSITAKISILKDRLSALSETQYLTDKEISKLAEQPLSPGEIDNVIRKILMKQVLTGQLAEFSEIINFCEEERIKKSVGGKRIGYL